MGITSISLENLSRYNDNIQAVIDSKIQKLTTDVQQSFTEHNANLHIYCTNDDILSLFNASTPEEPDTPVEPEVPAESVGSITEDNSIVNDETQLENGTYTLRYIDANENIIDKDTYDSLMSRFKRIVLLTTVLLVIIIVFK